MAGLVFRINATPISWDEAVALAAGSGVLATFDEVVSTGFIDVLAPSYLIPGPFEDYPNLAAIGWVNDEFGGSGADLAFVGYGDDIGGAFGSVYSYVTKVSGRLAGTSRADILYLTEPGTAEGGAGADHLWGSSGADTLLGGAGSDRIWSGAGADLIEDGAGVDFVTASREAWIKATLDGEGDFFNGGKLDYSRATQAITVTEFGVDGYGAMTVSSAEVGDDSITASTRLVTGSGDDNVYWRSGEDLVTGSGDDVVVAGLEGFPAPFVDLGAGDDEITFGYGGGRAVGGAGDDLLRYIRDPGAALSGVEFTGGAGHDTFAVDWVAGGGRIVIWDFALSGSGSDTFRLESSLDGVESVLEARDEGYLRLRQAGGYTTLQIDENGGGDGYVDAVQFKGNLGSALWDHVILA